MMLRHKKLREWAAQGLLTESQAAAIHDYEQARKAGRFGRGLTGLGIFAILVGVLSIIASNWHAIPPLVKIGGHALINVAVGAFAIRAWQTGKELWREGAVLAFLGLSFTLIVLVGQVYQLDGTFGNALAFWLVITLPFFLLLGNGYMTAAPWMFAFLTTIMTVMIERLEPLPLHYQQLFAIGVGALMPPALMADGMWDRFRKLRPALCDSAVRGGAALSIGLASFSLAFMDSGWLDWNKHMLQAAHVWAIFGAGLAGMAIHAVICKFYEGRSDLKYGAAFALAGFGGFMLPFLLGTPDLGIFSALPFILYWVFIGWYGQITGHMRLLSLSIVVIAIRIFVIYVELFGSLMDTGIGLISGGIVVLVLIAAARRLNKRLQKKGQAYGAL
ncbi:MAG: hypothetical protein DI626_07435 [Micavibrio aeruginosavorus]|uniref:DUF2157 domain-containing protein n=1 Tax=Micavibrio aeruginosavorus TaxID=349221 RepID=A0A2W4ZWG7_9BACT|nr:MAG: hypothetical protein DI626_07435 [Micavibrio aeruginosavorus]